MSRVEGEREFVCSSKAAWVVISWTVAMVVVLGGDVEMVVVIHSERVYLIADFPLFGIWKRQLRDVEAEGESRL